MHSQFIVLLLIGLAASTFARHLSDVDKRSLETEPRLASLLQDFYAQVVYPPLNHVVTSLALLSAQVLAGIAENGIPAPGGRAEHIPEAQLRGFFDDLWNNAIRPPIENALSGLSLLAAQLLAGIGTNGVNLGKRDLTEAEMRGFADNLAQAFQNIFTNVIQKPLEDALAGGALMLAQVLAGIGTNGIDLSAVVGKRDLTEAEMRGFADSLAQALQSVYANVIQKPLEDALAGGALMLAQVLAGIGTNGIDLSSVIGKRDLTEVAGREAELRGFFDTLGNNLLNGLQSVWTNIVQGPVEQAIQSSALLAAQVLAGIGVNGIDLGKRDLNAESRGEIIDSLVEHATGLITTQIKPAIENALNAAALHLAGILANFAQNGIGRR